MKRKLIAAIGVAVMVAGVAACGSDDKGSGKAAAPKEITVWLTVDAQKNWPELVKQADDAFAAKHKGVKIRHEYYEWTAKNQKLDAVLATKKVPDVVEMGNTETLGYLVKGAFAPIDKSKFENSGDWLDALEGSVTYNGKTYGVPYYAGARVGTWRKDVAKAAKRHQGPHELGRVDRRARQDPEEERRQVLRLVPAQPRLVHRAGLRQGRRMATSPRRTAASGPPPSPTPSPSRA